MYSRVEIRVAALPLHVCLVTDLYNLNQNQILIQKYVPLFSITYDLDRKVKIGHTCNQVYATLSAYRSLFRFIPYFFF